MKWRGRKQSTNIIDVRKVRTADIDISWGDDGDIIIGSNGEIYGSFPEYGLRLSLEITNPGDIERGWMPTMTSGQRETLRTIINMLVGNVIIVSVNQPSEIDNVMLAEFTQSVINNG